MLVLALAPAPALLLALALAPALAPAPADAIRRGATQPPAALHWAPAIEAPVSAR